MSEYIALKIREGDEAALNYYVTEMRNSSVTAPAERAMPCDTTSDAVLREREEISTFTAPAVDNTLISWRL
jgi:hypothetical protein